MQLRIQTIIQKPFILQTFCLYTQDEKVADGDTRS